MRIVVNGQKEVRVVTSSTPGPQGAQGVQGPPGEPGSDAVPPGGTPQQFVASDGVGGSFWRYITADLDRFGSPPPGDPSRVRLVTSLSDLAALYDDDADAYVLAADAVYVVTEHLQLGSSRLLVAPGCVLEGVGNPTISGDGPLLGGAGVSGNVVLKNLTFALPARAQLADLEGDTSPQLYVSFCAFANALVTVRDWDVASFKECFWQNAGVRAEGAFDKLFVSENVFFDIGAGNVAIDLDAATLEYVDVKSSFFKSPDGTALKVDAATVGEGIFQGNLMTPGVTPLEGVTDDNPQWFFSANSGVQDTVVVGESHSTAPYTVPIVTQDVPVPILGASASGDSTKRFTNLGDTRLQYVNSRPATVLATAVLRVDPAGNNQTVRAYFTLNGAPIQASSTAVRVTTGGDVRGVTLVDAIDMLPGDIIGLALANETSTSDVVADDVDLIVKG